MKQYLPWLAFAGGAALLALALMWLYHRRSLIKAFITDFLTPFATIARELRRSNELKELEMSERLNPKTGEKDPIYIITEEPGKHDTEVFYGTKDESSLTLRERLVATFEREAADD